MALLTIEDLHVSYGAIHAVRGISFEVEAGRIVTLIGANGAGKSTTLNTISGLLRPHQGCVRLEGEDLTAVPPHQIVLKGIVQVPEGRRIFGRLTVLENLEMGAFTRTDSGEIREGLDRTFSLFPRLKERVAQVAGTLSGGEQQMLAIGRALMARPRVLLLDEPSMGLAPILVEQIFDAITDINRQGTTILLVEQNAFMALNIAHEGYVLQTGSIALRGGASELQANEEVKRAYLGE
jgi:branched-chain amino acid transport system ATP-binding protein